MVSGSSSKQVKYAIIVEQVEDDDRILLPAYRYKKDAQLACQRLLDLESVDFLKLIEVRS